jgi:hypothetical protein
LDALGLKRVKQLFSGQGLDGIGYGSDFPVFWIDRFHPHSVRQHIAFAARSRTEVDAFYAAALEAGATDNGRRACVSSATTPPSFLIRMGTTSKLSFAAIKSLSEYSRMTHLRRTAYPWAHWSANVVMRTPK